MAARHPEDDVGTEADHADVEHAEGDQHELHESGRRVVVLRVALDDGRVARLEAGRREQPDDRLVGDVPDVLDRRAVGDVLAELAGADREPHEPDLEVVEDAPHDTAPEEVGGTEADELHGQTGQGEGDHGAGDGAVRRQRDADHVDQRLGGDHLVVEQRHEAADRQTTRDASRQEPDHGLEQLLAGERVGVVHRREAATDEDPVDPVGVGLPGLEVVPAHEEAAETSEEAFARVSHHVAPVVGRDGGVPAVGDRVVHLEDQVVRGRGEQHAQVGADHDEDESLGDVRQLHDPRLGLVPLHADQRCGQLDGLDLLAVLGESPSFGNEGGGDRRCGYDGVGHVLTSLGLTLTCVPGYAG